MKQLVCEACGSKELIKQDGVFVCQSCDTKYSVEEAAKMTTGIDTSASLEKALKNARRAMERKDYEQAEKFYGIILMEEPENWEATFYSTYAKAMGRSISEAANLVTNSIKTVLKDLKKLDDAVQQEKAITQISVDLLELCEAGYNSAIGDYNSTSVYSANDIYMAKVSCANDVIRYTSMLVFFGKELISEFGENEYTITKIVLFYETERKALDESLFGSIFNAQFDNESFINYLQESNCEHRKWLDKLNELTKAESSETIEAGESSEATEEKKPEPSRSDTILGCLIIIVMIVAVICIGRCACSGPSETPSEKPPETNEKEQTQKENGSNSIEYEGQTYKTVKIGTQTWMAENLNYNAKGSKCYDNNSENCKKCGRLYDREAAMKACPKGWHIPTKIEWDALEKFVGGDKVSGDALRAKTGWAVRNGTDNYGFSAFPCGSYDGTEFGNYGLHGLAYFWVSDDDDKRGRYLGVNYKHIGKYLGAKVHTSHSIRCIKD